MLRRNLLPSFGALFLLVFISHAHCIDVFYDPSCPHCQDELSFLYNISQTYNVTINEFNVENPKAMGLFENLSKAYNSSGSVPLTFIGDYAFVGFTYGNATQYINSKLLLGYSQQILDAIKSSGNECPSVLSISSIACSPSNPQCANVVTPSQAKVLSDDNKIMNLLDYVVLALALLAAVYLGSKIFGWHKK
ncbi:MAG: hypothetical protein ACP5T4_02515 [Candidatus Micrarchaeia archaeon]